MNYPPEFEELWDAFTTTPKFIFGSKGDKPPAYKQYKKKIHLHDKMLIAAHAQVQEKYRLRERGKFVENFKHIFRWIRDDGFDKEIVFVGEEKSFIARVTNRSWAK